MPRLVIIHASDLSEDQLVYWLKLDSSGYIDLRIV